MFNNYYKHSNKNQVRSAQYEKIRYSTKKSVYFKSKKKQFDLVEETSILEEKYRFILILTFYKQNV